MHEAVARIGQNNVTPAAMHAALNELSKEHADKAVIGNVLEAFMGTDDALWCTIVMDDERYEIFLFLGKGGRLRVFIKAGLHARFLRLGRLE